MPQIIQPSQHNWYYTHIGNSACEQTQVGGRHVECGMQGRYARYSTGRKKIEVQMGLVMARVI